MEQSDPTKEATSDMLEALERIQGEDKSDATKQKDKDDAKDEKEDKDDKSKDSDEEEEESDEIDLSDKKDDEDLAAWKERKEKGISKIVERTKAKEAQLDERLKAVEKDGSDAKFYLDNKKDIDGILAWMNKATKPETMEEAIAELTAMVKGSDYEPEVDSEKQLKTSLERKMAEQIAALKAELEDIKAPLQEKAKLESEKEAVKKKAEDTFDEVALQIEGTCNGYVLEKEHYVKALEKYPALDGADAVRLHLHSAIQRHTAGLASKSTQTKKEITDNATKKDAVPPADGDMVSAFEFLKAEGLIGSKGE